MLFEPMAVIAEALQHFLGTQADLEPVAYSNIEEFLVSLAGAALVLVSHYGVPRDIVHILHQVRTIAPHARIAVLSTDASAMLRLRTLSEGADGFLHKRAEPVAFLAALRRVAVGESIILDDAAPIPGTQNHFVSNSSRLTPREIEVLRLVARDRTAHQVARELGVSIRTVHVHLQNAYRKLGVHGRLAAVMEAQKGGEIGAG